MHELAALLVLTLGAGAAQSPAWLHQASLQAAAGRAARPSPLASPLPPDEAAPPPPCSGEFCQPQVALPGYTPRFTARTMGARKTLEVLDGLGLESAAAVGWWFAGTGLRLERTSAAMDAAANGGVGLGYFQVVMACRLDAFGGLNPIRRGR
ncbi:MAG TPA: hypothetical protein VFR85_07125 [Anaeromyxobacteraceae bacterium]|nr:hypothetical protein [Anaeromyxobacteraceae bacterium]